MDIAGHFYGAPDFFWAVGGGHSLLTGGSSSGERRGPLAGPQSRPEVMRTACLQGDGTTEPTVASSAAVCHLLLGP